MRPVEISWSKVRHLMGRRGPSGGRPNPNALLLGNMADAATRSWLANPATPLHMHVPRAATQAHEDAREEGRRGWRSARDRQAAEERLTEVCGILQTTLENTVANHQFHAPWRFRVDVDLDGTPAVLVGEADFLVIRDGAFDIYDLKMTADDDYWRATMGQLVFYDLAASISTGLTPGYSGLIQPLLEPPLLAFRFSDGERNQMWQHIIACVGH